MRRDILSLDVKLLLAFDALIVERGVTRAAQRLGLTQQGLSGQLAKMRALFDDPLFVREGGGVAPTPQAEQLYPQVLAALSGLRALVETPSFEPHSFDGVVAVAASDYAIAVILPPLLLRLRTEAPKLHLAVRPLNSATLGLEMRERRIDLALTLPQFSPPGLRSQRLFKERYIGAVRADHPLASDRVTIDRFCAYRHLLVSPDKGDFYGPTDAALAAQGRRRDIAVVVPSFAVVADILASTDLIAVLPERLLAQPNQPLHMFAPPVGVAGFDLYGFWPERLHADPLHRWFRKVCFGSLSRPATRSGV